MVGSIGSPWLPRLPRLTLHPCSAPQSLPPVASVAPGSVGWELVEFPLSAGLRADEIGLDR